MNAPIKQSMNRFFRKFILHKYSDQITRIGKQPVFILADDAAEASIIVKKLNEHENLHISANNAPFITQIGNLAFDQFVGAEANYCQAKSKFKGDKLEESLRKISFKNTFGNNYGFELNPFGSSSVKKLNGKLDSFRWGAIINPDNDSFAGLNYLFENMKAIYIFKEDKNETKRFLFESENCLCIEVEEVTREKEKVIQTIYSFLAV